MRITITLAEMIANDTIYFDTIPLLTFLKPCIPRFQMHIFKEGRSIKVLFLHAEKRVSKA